MTYEYYLDKKSFTIMWAKQRIVMIALFVANYLVLCLVGLSIVFFPKYFYFALACIMALAMFQGGLWFCARMSGGIRMFGKVKASHEGNGIILLETETNGSVAKKCIMPKRVKRMNNNYYLVYENWRNYAFMPHEVLKGLGVDTAR